MFKEWNPHDYVPWSDGKNFYALDGQDWEPGQSRLPDVAQVAMVQNLLTEDNLPSYHREIAMNFSMDGPWGQWVNRWTAEETRHSTALRDYLVVTRAVDPVELEKLRLEQMTRGFSPGQNQQGDMFAESVFDSVMYVSFQELATRVSHRNTGKACNDTIAEQLLARVSHDENLHMIFYRDVSAAGLDIAPEPGDEVGAPDIAQLQDARVHGAGVPAQGRDHRRRRHLRPAHPSRRGGDAGAEEVAHLRTRRLHRRGRVDARRSGVLVKELEQASDKFDESKQRYLEREARRTEKITASKVLKTEGTLTLSGHVRTLPGPPDGRLTPYPARARAVPKATERTVQAEELDSR